MSPDYEDEPARISLGLIRGFYSIFIGVLAICAVLQCMHLQSERDAALKELAHVIQSAEEVERQATECATYNEGILLKWHTPQPLPTRPPSVLVTAPIDAPMPDGRVGVEFQ